ncbi:unnamed protein product [Heligmosomoides polygyrus]|uniref:Rif1_N domain-containing protein n=1 Tax=Heligmosomoides polygyrus TaxID=6339 RepID=A0A3P8AKE2_HELPZ|nr:unnamed protein product [Heligmosomoides polygyrus]
MFGKVLTITGCDSKPSPSDPCQLTVDDAFVVLLDGLAVLRGKCGSAVQCSCVQSVLKEIYKAQPSKFLETSFHIIQCSTKNECPYSERLMPEEAMARFALMSAMGDMLCDTSLQPTCKILLTFAQRYHLKGFMKIRKFASKFVPRILETVDSSESPELERLSQGDPARWTEAVVASLKFVVFEEKDMVTFLLLLLSDEQLSSCRGSLTYRYSSTKLLVSGTVLSSVMSLLLVLVAEIDDWLELPSKVCEWISGAIPRANDTQCIVLFNALEVLASLTNREGFEMQLNVVGTMISCLNALPLPERSRVFSKRYLSMLSTYPKQLQVVDINRYFNAVSISDVLAFLYLLADVSAEIPSCIWDKASNLLSTRPNDAKLRELVVNHLSAGMENKLPNSLTRFKETLDKMNSSAQVDPEFLFSFCNGVLSRLPPQLSHYANQLIPHWIFAVLAFSTSREMDTKRFTSLIWDHAVRILNRVAPNTAMELSPGDSEAFVVRFFEALGSCTAPADVVRRVVTEAVPFHLANQLATFVKSDQIKEVEERIVRVCGVILKNVGQTLLVIAEADAHRGGLNRTAFVIMTQTTVTKMVKGSMDAEFLLQQVPSYVAMLASLPYRIFVYSRMKDLIFKFGEDPVIGQRIYAELTSAPGSAGLKQLTKDSDQRIKNFLSKHADNQFDDFD